MNLDSVTGAAAAAAATTPVASALGGLGTDGFMQLLIAQMRFQDPLAPSDPTSMMQQTSLLAQTEMITRVAQLQQQLIGLQSAELASDLIGTEISAQRHDGSTLSGVVEAVRFTAGGPTLVVAGEEVPLEATSELRA